MIVSQTPNRVTLRWLQALVLLFAVVVLPLGVTHAAAEENRPEYLERIDTDGDGEISAEERLAAANARRAAIAERMKTFEARLRAAVEAGEMTEEDARARLAGLRERLGQRVNWGAIRQRIEGAVEAGKMTREQAGEKLEGYRRRMRGAEEEFLIFGGKMIRE